MIAGCIFYEDGVGTSSISTGVESHWKISPDSFDIVDEKPMREYIQGIEISDPAAPSANRGRLYFKDNGAGKTQIVVRFPTGAVQVIATEP